MTYFDPQLIALQKEYAAQLLTHVNPYTGLPLVNDPAMAMLEITKIEKRVEALLTQMTLDEKIGQMTRVDRGFL